jgi:hypothetical protein
MPSTCFSRTRKISSMTLIKFSGLLAAIILAFSNFSTALTTSYNTQAHYEHMLSNYLNIWNGDLSLVDSTFSSTISVHADRFPSPTGKGSVPLNIASSATFEAFVRRARDGWDRYAFVPYKWVGGDNNIAVRWMLDGIVGANFTLFPTYVFAPLDSKRVAC